ncbi:MAG: hypothetical protein WDN06_10540 [Asticcacaulis sp.]
MGEVYLELQRNGQYLKCTAIDAATAEEAVAVGPVSDPEGVKRLAVMKLRNKLAERRGGASPGRGISV